MNTALLIIDVQEGLFSPSPYKGDTVIHNINYLITKAKQNKSPVIFIQHEHDKYIPFQSDSWQLHHKLIVSPDDIFIRKTTPNSFLRTNLQVALDKLSINQLIISGYATEFCVDTTIRQAAALGFPIILPLDANTTHDKPHANAEAIIIHHQHTLTNLTSFGVNITSLASMDIQF